MHLRAMFQASRADRRERSPCRWRWSPSTWTTPCGRQSKHRLKKSVENIRIRWKFIPSAVRVAPASEICSASALRNSPESPNSTRVSFVCLFRVVFFRCYCVCFSIRMVLFAFLVVPAIYMEYAKARPRPTFAPARNQKHYDSFIYMYVAFCFCDWCTRAAVQSKNPKSVYS